jgi:multiple sugar transport system substrate-binding protein
VRAAHPRRGVTPDQERVRIGAAQRRVAQDLVGAEGIELVEADIELGSFNDQLYAIVHGIQSPGLFSNQQLLEEHGVELPTAPDNLTWPEFHDLALQISEAGGDDFWGVDDVSLSHGGHFVPYLRQHGEDMWTEDGQIGFSPDTLRAWWTMWQEFRESGAAPPAEVQLEYLTFLDGSTMIQGLTAMHLRNTNQLLDLQGLSEDPIEVHLFPEIEGAADGWYDIVSNWVAASAASDHPDEAAAFVDFLLNDPDRALIMETTIGAPSSAALRQFLVDQEGVSAPAKRFIEHIDYEAEARRSTSRAPQGSGDVGSLMSEAAEEIALGLITVDEGVDRVFEEGPGLLEDAAR